MSKPLREQGSVHLALFAVIGVIIVGAIGVLFWSNFINKASTENIASYAECMKSEGSITQETYPETCVTKSGKSFTNPNQKADAPKAAALKEFCAPIEKLCFSYPENWTVKSEAVSQEASGLEERFIISDDNAKSWLRLETGMSGLGGACGNEDGSFVKILKTHTSDIAGKYLVNEGAEQYNDPAAYAVGLIRYDATEKKWSTDMTLNTSKPTHAIGKIDTCDVGLAVVNGKNAKLDPEYGSIGALSFRYYPGESYPVYTSESDASSALNAENASKAYAILQSAHYK